MGGGRLMKKLLYAQAHQRLRQQVEILHRQYRKARQAISERFPRCTWADWLRHQALAGDAAALAALRARQTLKGLSRNTLQGDGAPLPGPLAPVDTLTKQGTIIYRAGRGALRDDGTTLQVAREASPEDLEVALELAMARYGECLTVNGTTEFKQAIVQAAAAAQLPLTFADPVLERRRQALLMKEPNPEPAERPPPHRGAQFPHPRRWGALEATLTPAARAAAERYIAEREQKRLQGLAVPSHAPYRAGQGTLSYAGTRTVAGQPLALMQSTEAVLVLPIDAATARRLKRLAIGAALTVTPQGAIKLGTPRRR